MSSTLELTERIGELPELHGYVPHQQIDQNSDEDMFKSFLDWSVTLPNVYKIKSRTSIPSAIGLFIESKIEINHRAEREFCHIHTQPGPGSFHVKLPTEDLDYIVEKKRGEYHPMSDTVKGIAGKVGVALIYAPRNNEDLIEVKKIMQRAYDFAISA